MMKAKRNYKQMVNEKEASKALQADMEQAKDTSNLHKQKKEFVFFLEKKVNEGKMSPFIKSMAKRLFIDEQPLTENMVNALRKIMNEEKTTKAMKSTDYPTISLKIKPFLMKELNLDSRIVTGKVKAESAKAWLIEGHADMNEHMSFCVRCMKKLTEPASQVTGMGAICAEKAGIPYDSKNVLAMSKKEREKIRKQFIQKLQNQKFERWIPKSQAEVIEN